MARVFDGGTNKITPSILSTISSVHSVVAWIYNDCTENYSAVFNSNPNLGFFLRPGVSDRMSFYAATDRLSAGGYPQDVWSHFGYVQTGGTGTFYLNGATNGTITSSTSMSIDFYGDDNVSETFRGRLWDVRIYPFIALTQNEIRSCMRGRLVRPKDVGQWFMFDGSTSPEPDRSVSKSSGVLTGPSAFAANPQSIIRPFF